jgi:hypothetical protein
LMVEQKGVVGWPPVGRHAWLAAIRHVRAGSCALCVNKGQNVNPLQRRSTVVMYYAGVTFSLGLWLYLSLRESTAAMCRVCTPVHRYMRRIVRRRLGVCP